MSTVLVTGANRGIGLGLVKQYLKQKDVKHIFATARNPKSSTDLLALSDPRLHLVQLDVACDDSIKAAAEKVAAIVGDAGLELLINNSGILNNYTVDAPSDRKALTQQFDVNTIAPLLIFQEFLPLLRKAASAGNAKVINISSALGSCLESRGSGDKDIIAYSMSKSALNQLTKSLSIDFAKENIYVYAFSPGWVQTDMGSSAAMLSAAMLTVEQSTSTLLSSFARLSKETSGGFFDREFNTLPY